MILRKWPFWLRLNLGGAVIGVWAGALIAAGLNWALASLFPPPACSGFPCGSAWPELLLSVCMGGALGTMITYLLVQGLLRRTIAQSAIITYACVGVVTWPFVCAMGLLAHLAALRLTQRATTSVSTVGLAAGLTISACVIGTIMAISRRARMDELLQARDTSVVWPRDHA